MNMPDNPFFEKSDGTVRDSEYAERAANGDNAALEALVLRHQSWIYNIAVPMCGDATLAEDITQEILIKMITKLSTYDPARGSFRTWLYRIVANHVINMKQSGKEKVFGYFSSRSDARELVEFLPDNSGPVPPGNEVMDRETRITCALCILMCLSRRERLVFVLGVIFDVPDRVGSELCDISRDNYRTILSRSRNKVFRFFNTTCGLLREGNPCRCERQTEIMTRAGLIDAQNPMQKREAYGRIRDMAGRAVRDLEDAYYEFLALIKDRPFFKGPDMVEKLRDLLRRKLDNTG